MPGAKNSLLKVRIACQGNASTIEPLKGIYMNESSLAHIVPLFQGVVPEVNKKLEDIVCPAKVVAVALSHELAEAKTSKD